MKSSNIKIKEYSFRNSWEIEYKVGRDYFIACIETEDLKAVFDNYDYEKHDTPANFLEEDEDVEKLLTWFHTEFTDELEPISRKESELYQAKIEASKEEKEHKLPLEQVGEDSVKVHFKTTFDKQNGMWTEVPNPAYIKALAQRMEQMQKEIDFLKEENQKRDDVLLTTKMIEYQYKISKNTINEARRHNRITGFKINGKEYGYKKREIEKYIQGDRRLQKAAL
ncbi:hypothetical protein WAF17_16655 [Bernardetia sp. ABR2-2B]|uniref:hypothetical protein n=1 Tax=Bernardetia sp. ABR2-2B TaxID=3127472 RepID=UPI0030CD78AC